MRSAWAGGLHLRSRAERKARAGGNEINKFKQSAINPRRIRTREPCYSRLFR
jgi:hypothetical protein